MSHTSDEAEKEAKQKKEKKKRLPWRRSVSNIFFALRQVWEVAPVYFIMYYAMTFVCAYSCGRYGYIPSSLAWDAGGYEVDTCKYVKGTGEMLVDEFTGMLKELQSF